MFTFITSQGSLLLGDMLFAAIPPDVPGGEGFLGEWHIDGADGAMVLAISRVGEPDEAAIDDQDGPLRFLPIDRERIWDSGERGLVIIETLAQFQPGEPE